LAWSGGAISSQKNLGVKVKELVNGLRNDMI
jgi:hypothetical protein